ncbi:MULTISPECIES: uracil phosphoribosyltransferase [Cysteiniphilum]|uniref:Uracil phosphoribosyltransferase n=1 Tax=Cysteiniphilum litorale TaxID=2056700 RepID=A0A8J3E991_9GAMM|nr:MULTISPECIES: uracil phosphoribosyltransferase [Cysteiniphilum]GGG05633.1 uracil phosphoribosyltransferase [Cysteiniphilum litorale]
MKTHEIVHPIVQHKLSLLRDESTSSRDFRMITSELAMLLCYEALSDLMVEEEIIEHWQGRLAVPMLKKPLPTFCPILRAGLGMLDGALSLLPNAPVTMIGVERDEETAKPREYYFKACVDINKRTAVILDPMLATAGSINKTISLLKSEGCKHFIVVTLLASPEGIVALEKAHPEVELYTASIDQCLNEKAYIIPGLGDAGDKIFATK